MITNPNPNIIRPTKNHESQSEYSGFGEKDLNPNLNIRYNTDILCKFFRKNIYENLYLKFRAQSYGLYTEL